VQNSSQRPDTNREDETEPRTDPVENLAEQGLTERIGERKDVDDDGVVGFGQAKVSRNFRPENRERAAIDVVDDRRERDETDNKSSSTPLLRQTAP